MCFDSPDQVRRHFHVFSGRVVVFFPSALPVRQGEPVVLDVSFTASDQHCVLRGNALALGAGEALGSWLEFSAHGLVAGLESAAATAKRRHRRFPTNLFGSVERAGGMPAVCRVLDVAMGGARLSGVSFQPRVGEPLGLALFGSESGKASGEIAWVRGREVGVRFVRHVAAQRFAVSTLVDVARQHLAEAVEVAHPAVCRCTQGAALVEPALPRSAYRSTAIQ